MTDRRPGRFAEHNALMARKITRALSAYINGSPVGEFTLRDPENPTHRMPLPDGGFGYAPSIPEIAGMVGLESYNSVRQHLIRLADKGVVRIQPRVARAIVLTEEAKQYL